MPIPAGVVDRHLPAALFATVKMPAQRRRAAVPQMPHDFAGMGFHGMPPAVLRPVLFQHVRHPKARTTHLPRLKQHVTGRAHLAQMVRTEMTVHGRRRQ